MPSPKDLLDERLARGEITHEEYDRVVGKLALQSQAPAATPPLQSPAPASGLKREGWWGFVIFGIGANIFIVNMLSAGVEQGYTGRPNGLGVLLVLAFSLVAIFGFIKLGFGK